MLTHIHSGYEEEWNDWYENDHFYAGGVLSPGVLSGARWHAPRQLRQARFATSEWPFPHRGGGALATYFLTVPDGSARFREWIAPQVPVLRDAGRMFENRDLINCDFYAYAECLRGPGASSVAPHVLQLRPYRTMFVTFASGHRETPAKTTDLPRESVTLVLPCQNEPLGHATQPDLSSFAPLTLLLTYTDDVPPAGETATAELASSIAGAVGTHPLWAGAFLPIIPGDDGFLRDFT
ncbi:hypothetical protein HFP15_22025 [Amycolatopsis sp. K13G38]|uniref:Uncharacterized protein n=1 Tax=Amycolatopsis acididurans TaxID=2724524 RepID=A0ABX1J6Z7_9PSEU|nr:hypothetical protein [Amycolatopsis acididurans]NKQ55566.1 hypothetical protein [Amycolatopsis acididurans]